MEKAWVTEAVKEVVELDKEDGPSTMSDAAMVL
jgi:hypothetical protein